MPPISMFIISRKTPAVYFTAVTHHSLPIFRTDQLKQVLCQAYAEARSNHGILILAYVIMTDHVHMLVRSDKTMSEILRLMNGISARRIIQHLTDNGHERSLFKLRGSVRGRNHKHSVGHHHTDSLEIFGESTFRQKLEYIHQNPVRAGIVEKPSDYLYASARIWAGRGIATEPLQVDHRSIQWRRDGAA